MDKIFVKKAETINDAEELATLAEKIWTEHYVPIIGTEQVKYMLSEFQSKDKIYRDILENGYIYFMLYYEGNLAGYAAIKHYKDEAYTFLSKLYIDKDYRGLKLARKAIELVTEKAALVKSGYIMLTVNKYNANSINAYEKMGFIKSEAIVTDIGNGYVMDDYVMKLHI